MKIGLISDTHNHLDPRVEKIFAGVDHILHAGDVGDTLILSALEAIAPLTAVLGNNDYDLSLPETAVVELGGKKFLVHHIVSPGHETGALRKRIKEESPDVVVFGHTHQKFARQAGAILYLNPGYAGRPRFNLERAVAILEIDGLEVSHRFITL